MLVKEAPDFDTGYNIHYPIHLRQFKCQDTAAILLSKSIQIMWHFCNCYRNVDNPVVSMLQCAEPSLIVHILSACVTAVSYNLSFVNMDKSDYL